MNKLFIFFITVIFLFSYTQVSWSYTVKGSGNTSCGELLEEEKNRTSQGILFYQKNAWILGYITGRNYENNANKGRGVHPDSIYYAVLNYCRDNPLKDLDDAIQFIYDYELK